MKPKKRVYCPDIERPKMLFETKKKADRCIEFNEEDIRKNGSRRFKKLRSYYCPACGGWHITHADLNSEERQERDQRVIRRIQSAKRIKNIKVVKNTVVDNREIATLDISEFLKKFDLKSYGGKKKFKAFLKENNLIPTEFQKDKVFHVINEMPPECFDASIPESTLSEEEITKTADDLYFKIPFQKLKDPKMIHDYIKWEFGYNQKVNYKIIKRLNKLCGLQ